MMINIFEIKNYLCEALGIDPSSEYIDIRRQSNNITFRRDATPREKCIASILCDTVDYYLGDEVAMSRDKGELKDCWYLYRFFLETFGRSFGSVALAIEVFNKLCSEIGINKIHLRLSRNWSNSALYLDKVIRGLRESDWVPTDYIGTKLILEKNKKE